jgi:hypothetical protein
VPFFFGEDAKRAGAVAQINCIVQDGDLPIQLIWTIQGKTVDPGSHQQAASDAKTPGGVTTYKIGEKTSILTIDSVTAAHSGVYRCLARNPVGESSHFAELMVNGQFSFAW